MLSNFGSDLELVSVNIQRQSIQTNGFRLLNVFAWWHELGVVLGNIPLSFSQWVSLFPHVPLLTHHIILAVLLVALVEQLRIILAGGEGCTSC